MTKRAAAPPFTHPHIATPYAVSLRTQDPPQIVGAELVVCEITTHTDSGALEAANAAFIVRACNAHDALVAALDAARSVIEDFVEIAPRDDPCTEERAIHAQALAALKLAKGE